MQRASSPDILAYPRHDTTGLAPPAGPLDPIAALVLMERSRLRHGRAAAARWPPKNETVMDSVEHPTRAEHADHLRHFEHLVRFRLAERWAKDRRVLVVSFGDGQGLRMLLDAGARLVVAVDLSCEGKAPTLEHPPSPRLHPVCASAERLPFPSGYFDLAVSFETIDRVRDNGAFVAELHRVLRADGLLVASTRNRSGFGDLDSPGPARAVTVELSALLGRRFRYARILPQFLVRGSAVVGESDSHLRADLPFPVDLSAATHLVAVCGDSPLPREITSSIAAGLLPREGGESQDLDQGFQEPSGDAPHGRGEQARARLVTEHTRQLQELGARHDATTASLRRELAAAQAALREIRRGRAFRVIAWYWSLRALLREKTAALATWMGRWRWRAGLGALLEPARGEMPLVSVIVPVYNHAEYLPRTIDSILNQTYGRIEVVLWDDASPDPRVPEVLSSYARRDGRVRHYRGADNLGISGATNEAIIRSSGQWLAFVDCDDLLLPNAIESVMGYARRHPEVGFIFTNRTDIDERDAPVRDWDFVNRAIGDIGDELLKGMFVSHLKTVRRDDLMRAGLFRSRYDLSQDYDHVLRLSEVTRIGFLREAVYRHRVHTRQSTQQQTQLQEQRAGLARQEALLRRAIASGQLDHKVSVVVPVIGLDDTRRCLESLERHTALPCELILLDTGTDPLASEWLRAHVAGNPRSKVVAGTEGPGGDDAHRRALRLARGDLIVTVEGDVEVTAGWLQHLLARLLEAHDIGGACCRAVLPNGTVQFTGGACAIDEGFVRFSLVGSDLSANDLASLREQDCGWIPSGAMAFRRVVYEQIESLVGLDGAFRAHLLSLAARRAGWRLVNAPLATVLRHGVALGLRSTTHAGSISTRLEPARIRQSIIEFHQLTGLVIEDEDLYGFLGLPTDRARIRELLLHAPTLIARQRS